MFKRFAVFRLITSSKSSAATLCASGLSRASTGPAATVKRTGTRAPVSPTAASQSANAPLVGFLNSASPVTHRFNADAFRKGLAKADFVEGHNLRIEERLANGDYHALPALAAELVAKGVVAIDKRLS